MSQTALNLAEGEGNLIVLSDVPLLADPRGALYWPEHRLLAVADLHLEKGSSFAARGQMLPPYDTATTLARLSVLIADYSPRCVVSLGDSFHDGGGPTRLGDKDRAPLQGCNADATGYGSPAIMIPSRPKELVAYSTKR